ncbi:hypothetical protein H9P43_007123 [Blastocladiella emersonii ATCC 22665]|nr:hypothetical protein H9P43_007123 [Blastocladiella emersonii ATCC 22665]
MSDAGSDVDPQEQAPTIGTYEGERMATGERHGKGRNTFPNGDIYEGEYSVGRREGTGTYTWKKPRALYVGGYRANVRHGAGAMVYPDGGRYRGEWALGRRHGAGLYVYPNGDTYDGEWAEDLKHGKGVYTFAATGSRVAGTWDKGFLSGAAEIAHRDHVVRGNYTHIRESVPVNPDDDSAGTVEVVKAAKLELPCAVEFKKSGHVVPSCWVPEQVGLGVPVAADDADK